MSAKRSALGRGLNALIPSQGQNPRKQPPQGRGAAVVEGDGDASAAGRAAPTAGSGEGHVSGPQRLPVARIDPNPDQPRRHFDAAELQKLAQSILRHGVLQPIVVRRVGDRYQLVVGERRWRASRAAGIEDIPAVVADVDPDEQLEIAIVENVQRHDLNPMELAIAYRALADQGHTQEEIGQKVSMDRSSIANHLRLLELSRDLQEDVEAGRLSMGHAKAILQVTNPERRRHVRDRILSDGLSVRAAEKLARETAGPGARRKPAAPQPAAVGSAETADPNTRDLIERLEQRYQARVSIRDDAGKGRIEIDFAGAEDLVRITSILLGEG
jgi:ParB family chromosome partitioning protein